MPTFALAAPYTWRLNLIGRELSFDQTSNHERWWTCSQLRHWGLVMVRWILTRLQIQISFYDIDVLDYANFFLKYVDGQMKFCLAIPNANWKPWIFLVSVPSLHLLNCSVMYATIFPSFLFDLFDIPCIICSLKIIYLLVKTKACNLFFFYR